MLLLAAEKVLVFFLLIIISLSCNKCNCEEYYITATAEDVCPMQPCTTLSHFTSSLQDYDPPDNITVLNFLPGNHSLHIGLSIVNMDIFIMRSWTNSSSSSVIISCQNSSYFMVTSVRYASISNIEFIGCGGNTIKSVNVSFFVGTIFKGFNNSGTALQLIDTNIKIASCQFMSNTMGSLHGQLLFHLLLRYHFPAKAGGALVSIHSNVSIEECIFYNNRAEVGGAIFARRSSILEITGTIFVNNVCLSAAVTQITLGGAIYLEKSAMAISESAFDRNSAFHFGGAIFSIYGIIRINNSSFQSNYLLFGGGGALVLQYSITAIEDSQFVRNSAYSGGVVFAFSSMFSANGSRFIFNRAIGYGGVIVFSNGRIVSVVDNSTLANSTVPDMIPFVIEQCSFSFNSANSGGSITFFVCDAIIKACQFHHNAANDTGGVADLTASNLYISDTTFASNKANSGGVLRAQQNSTINVDKCFFSSNSAILLGGAIIIYTGTVTMKASQFNENTVSYGGGALQVESSMLFMDKCEFLSNRATLGGALLILGSNSTIHSCHFLHNTALLEGEDFRDQIIRRFGTSYFYNTANHGGAMFLSNSSINIQTNSTQSTMVSRNQAKRGAAIYALNSTLTTYGLVTITENTATEYSTVYVIESIGHFMGMLVISNNTGSFLLYNSNVTFTGKTLFQNCSSLPENTAKFEEGGAVTLYQSNLFIKGDCKMERNEAKNGGTMLITESKVFISSATSIVNSKASIHGGAVYLFQSEINCQKNCQFQLMENSAIEKGGGIHAVSSLIKVTCSMIGTYYFDKSITQFEEYSGEYLMFMNNSASRGGGLSLESNSKLYVLKTIELKFNNNTRNITFPENITADTIQFTLNSAIYGGAIFVDDNTDSGTCASTSSEVTSHRTECFFQVLALHTLRVPNIHLVHYQFSQNYAKISGSTLYGGLLDRCTLSPFSEVHNKYDDLTVFDGLAYFDLVTTNTSEISLSSQPVQLCICTEHSLSCSYHQSGHVKAKKGDIFNISLVAVDQMYQPVNAIIQGYLDSTESDLIEGQVTQIWSDHCTNISFRIFSPHTSELLTLYASDGPCKDTKMSTKTFSIQLLPCTCPIGFQPLELANETNCVCECHNDIIEYVQCNSTTESFIRQSNVWITDVTLGMDSDALIRYFVYDHCPFDYCGSISTPVNLNLPNGVDMQCALNRTGTLCGSCKPGFSLSLGSSLCLQCPDHWPLLLVAIIVAVVLSGIALVTALLVLNMTVAVGTLNAIIFYANIIASNRSLLLPFSQSNFITVFVSWLNLELGIDVCFFHTMDAYAKTWLQLAFPIYLIILVAGIIIISDHSSKFSRLFRKKNPVATLATLVLLSYTKLLQTVITALSFGVLKYPNGSREIVWLPDASIKYLSGKHIALFIATLLILLIGTIYTTLLFSWQWLLRSPKSFITNWARNTKVYSFIETYDAPYAPEHRYWAGMLLFVRAVVYIVSAVNVSGNPQIAFLSITYSVSFIILTKAFIASKVYKKTANDILDMLTYINILLYVTFMWYTFNGRQNQEAFHAAYVSVNFTFVLLIAIIFYHMYTYTMIFAKLRQTTKRFHKFLKKCINIRSIGAPKLQQNNVRPPVMVTTIAMSECESCDDTIRKPDDKNTTSNGDSRSNSLNQHLND